MDSSEKGTGGKTEHETSHGLFRQPVEKETGGYRGCMPVNRGLQGFPYGNEKTNGTAAQTQVLPLRVSNGLSRMAGSHGHPEKHPVRDAGGNGNSPKRENGSRQSDVASGGTVQGTGMRVHEA
ncbi:hypothetical protein [Bacteroides sp. HPS0048]|uniref:hypothetical protein n=1 Tax=Bacteroides sp. HPS0048 TaxID=1078089 RepID=UPI003563A3D6